MKQTNIHGEVFSGINLSDLMNDAIKGSIDNKTIFSKIINLFGKEVRQTITIVRQYYCSYCST